MPLFFLTGVQFSLADIHVIDRIVAFRLVKLFEDRARSLRRKIEQLSPLDEALRDYRGIAADGPPAMHVASFAAPSPMRPGAVFPKFVYSFRGPDTHSADPSRKSAVFATIRDMAKRSGDRRLNLSHRRRPFEEASCVRLIAGAAGSTSDARAGSGSARSDGGARCQPQPTFWSGGRLPCGIPTPAKIDKGRSSSGGEWCAPRHGLAPPPGISFAQLKLAPIPTNQVLR